ncbi:MAG: hypothetical protein Kow0031_41430 [Anaerolineae bacterium]
MANKIAVEFVRNVLLQNPNAKSFGDIYDALTRAASTRSFHNLGHTELNLAGISFSLHGMDQLAQLIAEVQSTGMSQDMRH